MASEYQTFSFLFIKDNFQIVFWTKTTRLLGIAGTAPHAIDRRKKGIGRAVYMFLTFQKTEENVAGALWEHCFTVFRSRPPSIKWKVARIKIISFRIVAVRGWLSMPSSRQGFGAQPLESFPQSVSVLGQFPQSFWRLAPLKMVSFRMALAF